MNEPTQEEINKSLTDAMGECWHWWVPNTNTCTCGRDFAEDYIASTAHTAQSNNNFFTWDGFGKLWRWCNSSQFQLGSFISHYTKVDKDNMHLPTFLINPTNFANAVYNFLKGYKK